MAFVLSDFFVPAEEEDRSGSFEEDLLIELLELEVFVLGLLERVGGFGALERIGKGIDMCFSLDGIDRRKTLH